MEPFLYGIGLMIFGAFIELEWLMTLGLFVFLSGFVLPFLSIFSDELKETGWSLVKVVKFLVPEKKDKGPLPSDLVKDVEKLRTSNMDEVKFKSEVKRLTPLISDYPSLQKKLKNYKQRAYIKYRVEEHENTLQRNLSRALVKDDYGTVIKDEQDSEILRFLESMNANTDSLGLIETISLVKEALKELEKAQLEKGFDPKTAPEDGLDFEHWVAERLKQYGWSTHVTKGSGDQGADVVARLGNQTIGIQCKRYTKNVGNKAIQEAISAAQHYRFDKAAVITTSYYTKSAKELAASTGVLLLTHYDIPKLAHLAGID